jgi:predicted DNA-binding transcriptional regulator YafY
VSKRHRRGDGNGSGPGGRPLLRRLLAYREWLRAGRPFTAAGAAAELEVSERTVLRDMRYLQSLGWDVDFCRVQRAWRLREEGMPLPLLQLRQGELLALVVGTEALRQYAGTPYAAELGRALAAIVAVLDAPVTLDLDRLGPLPRFVAPPSHPVDPAQFQRLSEACARRRRLAIRYYVPERDEVTGRVIDPYHLFEHDGGWYVAALDHRSGEPRTFALGGRLREARETGETYEPDPDFDLDGYLGEGFGIFRGGTREEVVLRFEPTLARYIRERVWDGSETKEDQPDGSLILRLHVPVNVGLKRFVLQYGAEVQVLAPQSLREAVRAEWERALTSHAPQNRPTEGEDIAHGN